MAYVCTVMFLTANLMEREPVPLYCERVLNLSRWRERETRMYTSTLP